MFSSYHARVLASEEASANQEPSLGQRLGSGLATLQQVLNSVGSLRFVFLGLFNCVSFVGDGG